MALKALKGKFICMMAAFAVLAGGKAVTSSAASTPTTIKTLPLIPGEDRVLPVQGANIKSKAFKSTNTKIATVDKFGTVTAKKRGNCQIKITVKYLKSKKAKKVSKKVLTTKVTVDAKESQYADAAVVKKIIKEQKALGNKLPDDFGDKKYYRWDDNKRLVYLNWGIEDLDDDVSLKGKISFSGLTALKELKCNGNGLDSIDVSGCTALVYLECGTNNITELDTRNCKQIKYIDCSDNKLAVLNISGCTAMKVINCQSNSLQTLDISGLTELKCLDCSDNQITSLNLDGCKSLESLYCRYNQIASLDLGSCPVVEVVRDDDETERTGLPENWENGIYDINYNRNGHRYTEDDSGNLIYYDYDEEGNRHYYDNDGNEISYSDDDEED